MINIIAQVWRDSFFVLTRLKRFLALLFLNGGVWTASHHNFDRIHFELMDVLSFGFSVLAADIEFSRVLIYFLEDVERGLVGGNLHRDWFSSLASFALNCGQKSGGEEILRFVPYYCFCKGFCHFSKRNLISFF